MLGRSLLEPKLLRPKLLELTEKDQLQDDTRLSSYIELSIKTLREYPAPTFLVRQVSLKLMCLRSLSNSNIGHCINEYFCVY
jgi:hypothetical protein